MKFSPAVNNLIEALRCLPGVGPKSAQRMTFHLLERNRVAMLRAYLTPRTQLLLAPALLFTEAVMWSYAFLRGPAFLRAKLRSYRWVRRHRAQIGQRRRLGERVRIRSDLEVLRGLRWGYPMPQLVTLARERGNRPRRRRADPPEAG